MGSFAAWLRAQGARPATVDKRRVVIAAALRGWPDEPTADDVTAWLGRPGWSQWTRVTYYGHARSWFAFLVETGRRAEDPTARMKAPRSPRPQPRPLTDADVARVLSVAAGRVRLWVLLGLLAGLRAHEIAHLRREDVTAATIFVRGKGGREDYVPTHPELWTLIAPIPPGWLFPTSNGAHVAGHTVSLAVSALFRSVGVAGSLHRCRHTFASRLLRQGTNIRVVQRLMRHASLETTARYLAIEDDEALAAVLRLVA